MLAIFLASIVVASGASMYQASETTTRWRATTYTLTYTSTYTTWELSFPTLLSTSTILRTFTGDVTGSLEEGEVGVRQESAPRYSVTALIIGVPLPSGAVKRLESEVMIKVHYRSSKNMTLEEIGMDDWEKIRKQDRSIITYYPTKIEIQGGTGTWTSWNLCFESNVTVMEFVFMSKEALPDVLSVDAFLISKDVATSTSTSFSTRTRLTETTVYETFVETYRQTEVSYIPVVETMETTPFTTRTTQTRSETTPSPTITTSAPTATAASPVPGPWEPSFTLVLIVVLIVMVAAGVIIARGRRKPASRARVPSPPPI